MDREKDGSAYAGAGRCRCGSRATKRVEGLLTRKCSVCCETFAYRLRDGLLVPFAKETAAALDEQRRVGL